MAEDPQIFTATPQRYDQLVAQLVALHRAKSQDYDQPGHYLSNLRTAERFGAPAWLSALLKASDKWERLCNLTKRDRESGEGPAVADETVEDTALDLANYMLFFVLLRREWTDAHDRN